MQAVTKELRPSTEEIERDLVLRELKVLEEENALLSAQLEEVTEDAIPNRRQARQNNSSLAEKFAVEQLSLLEGITFTGVRHHMLVDTTPTRRYSIQGHSFGFCFNVTFDVSESSRIVKAETFAVELHTTIIPALTQFTPTLISSCGVLPFFEIFSRVSALFHKRKHLFLKLQSLFADHVSIPMGLTGSVLYFTPPSSLHLVLLWDIWVDKSGKLHQNLKLNPKVSRQHLLLDRKSVLHSLSVDFPLFVAQKGLTAALVILFKACTGTWVN